MDSKDFDRLARSAAGGLSRRRVMAWFGAGSAATMLTAPGQAFAQSGPRNHLLTAMSAAQAACTIHLTGTVRVGPSAGQMLTTKATTPGELKGNLTFTLGKDGEIDSGQLLLADGKKLKVVGQVVGRALNLRISLADKRTVILVGTAAEDLTVCHGGVDGLMTGPEPGDIGDWHSSATAAKTTNSSGSNTAAPTATTAAGNGGGNNGGGDTCPDGQGDCGDGCIDLLSDVDNCGGCGKSCGAGQTCANGKCIAGAACQEGETECPGGCTDVTSDAANCGGCGMACDETLVCVNSTCCLADEICDGVCTDVLSDVNNCGACGTVCVDGEICDMGACSGGCTDGEIMCNDICVCFGCEANCTDCGDTCAENELCCGTDVGCLDILSDPTNCGGCGLVCDEGQTCTDGLCG